MNAPILSAVTSQTGKQTGSAATAAHARDAKVSQASFSAVLSSQQSAPQNELGGQIAGLPGGPADPDTGTAEKTADDQALPLLAGAQGVLPPLVLDTAARLGTQAAGAAGRAKPGLASTLTNDAARPAGADAPPHGGASAPQAVSRAIADQLAAAQASSPPMTTPADGRDVKTDRFHARRPSGQDTGSAAGEPGRNPAGDLSMPTALLPASEPGRPAPETALDATATPSGIDLSALQGPSSASKGNSAAAPTIVLRVETPLQSRQWADEFGQQFLTLTSRQAQNQTAELHINPPDLGPLRISLQISDNVAHAIFVSPHAAVRTAVENALPQLQQALAQSGISLGQTNVGDQRQFAEKFQSREESKRRISTTAPGAAGRVAAHDSSARASLRAASSNSLVDTFV